MEIISGTVLINPSNRESIQVHFEQHIYCTLEQLARIDEFDSLEDMLDYFPGRLAL